MDEVGTEHEVAEDAGICGNPHSGCVLEGQRCSHCVRGRANAADALGDVRRILGIAPHENLFKAPELCSGALRVGHLLLAADGIDRDLDFHVSFNSGHGINNGNCSHISISRLQA